MDTFDTLNWSTENRLNSLQQVYDYTVKKVQHNIEWYTRNARIKKQSAQRIRLLSLIFLGLGTIIPVLIDVTDSNLPASWATLVLAFGSGLLVLDRFMGYSTGWMRFLLTEMLLKAKLESFQFQWVIESARHNQGNLPDDEITNMLNRFAAFRAEVSQIVQDETQLWVEEFQSNLRALDENFHSVSQLTRSGAISIKIENTDAYAGGWDLEIDGKHVESSRGQSTAVKDIAPGFRKVTVIGKDAQGGKSEPVSEILTVTPGSHTSITLKLPPLNES